MNQPDTYPNLPSNSPKRWLALMMRVLLVLLVVLSLLCVLIFYIAGTEAGTKFVLDQLTNKTGIKLQYKQGNLRDGLWLSDVELSATDTLTLKADKLYARLGWRALLMQQVHLIDPEINALTIIDSEAPTGKPFLYETLALPVGLYVANARVGQVSYQQATQEPINLYDIYLAKGTWVDTKAWVNGGQLTYDKTVTVKNIKGDIELAGYYPVNASADVDVAVLQEHYFDTFHLQATGTLKRTVGTLTGRYHGYAIQGDVVIQSLDDGTPLDARITFEELVLPYAEEQTITLKQGLISAQGTPDKLWLRFNSDLSGKDIPAGRYTGRALLHPEGMAVKHLQATTASGELFIDGTLSWAQEFELVARVRGHHYQVRDVLPVEYQEYKAYLPQRFNGTLGVHYFYLDKQNNTRLELDLSQKDGEKLAISLAQSQDRANAPWHIHANWQSLKRSGVPELDNIDSPHGSADIRLEEGRTFIDAKAQIQSLMVAPKGDYALKAHIDKGERIGIEHFDYRGVLGDLSGTGKIDLASVKAPLRWQFKLQTNEFKPNAYFDTPDKTPFLMVRGQVLATGQMQTKSHQSKSHPAKRSVSEQVHRIELADSDLTAILADNHHVRLLGGASAKVGLAGKELTHINASFDGSAEQSLLPKMGRTKLSASVRGNLEQLDIDKLTVFNDLAKLSLAGRLKLGDDIKWQLGARIDELDTSKLTSSEQLIAKITGNLDSTGIYKNNELHTFTAKFDGVVSNKHLPNGTISADVAGNAHKLTINHLSHRGQAGDLHFQGKIDVDKMAIDMHAQSKRFNVGKFVQGINSELTGKIHFLGSFGEQIKSLAINGLDVHGQLNGQPITASGSLMAKLAIPKDIKAYFRRLKLATSVPKSTNELIDLPKQIQTNTRQTQQIIKQLKADNLHIKMGDNFVNVHGNEQKLATTVQMMDLGQIVPSARGTIKGGAILVNDNNALPTLYIDLKANEIRTASAIVQKALVLGKIENLAQSPSQLLVEIEDMIAFGRVVKSAHMDFRGTQSRHALSFMGMSSDVALKTYVNGGFDEERGIYRGVLGQGEIKTKFGTLAQNQPSEFSYQVKDNGIQVAPHCWQTHNKAGNAGVMCLQETLSISPKFAKVGVVLQNLDTSVLSPVLPSDMVWQSTLSGKTELHWQQGKIPVVNAVLYSDNGRVGLTQDDTGYVEVPYERVSLIAQSVPTGLKLRTDIVGLAGRGYVDVLIDPHKKDKPIKGAMALNDINLAVLRPFFSNLQTLSGTISMAGGLGGTLASPLFYGNAELTGGQLSVLGVPLNLSGIDLTANIRGTQAKLEGGFNSGTGKGVITGELDWQHELQAKIGISGTQLIVDSPPMLSAKLSPDIELIIRPIQKYVKVQGVVSVPSATIRPPSASADIVTQSDDVVVIDRRLTGNVAQILKVSAPWSINADIGLDLGDEVVFRGFGANLPLAGALHLTQSGQGAMRARGVIQVAKRAKVDGIGQNLELNYAQIRFNGDMLNPRLSIEGEKQIEGHTVGLRIKGTASSPDITVFNDAGLTEQQAMNALITGRISEASDAQTSEQSFRTQVTNNLAAAGLSLGLSGTRNLTNQIGSALGLESLTVDASGNSSDTHVNITGYISPDLYIRYGVGVFNAQSTLSMRYQLTRRIYVEATRATENVVDVIYRWKF